MSNFIAIPLKKTNEVDLVKPLKNLFSGYCSSADEPVNYDEALSELNKLRMNSTWRTLDKHESSLEIISKYYDQLNFLDAKCPSMDFQVSFKWRDAFDKASFFGGSTTLTLSNLNYEKACILFNIAAMQSQIAVGHGNDTRNDEGLKLAAKYFQMSSGTFHHLKSMVSQLHQDPTPDMQPDTLMALSSLMLAQAQESFCHKAMSNNMKESVIAKIASQCDTLYAETLKYMQKESTRVMWEKDWLALIAGKQAGFQALAEYYQSLVCKSQKDYGEEIARLKLAGELIKLADIRGGGSFTCLKDYESKTSFAFEEAKKDNDFIYHARVPDTKSLPPIGKAALAKSTLMPEKLYPNSQDLFPDLLPLPVQQALQTFDVRKAEMINSEKAKIGTQTQLLNGILASLNLPAALEDTTGESLPQSLREKAQAVRDKGGVDSLQNAIRELPALLQRNKELLEEANRLLTDEEETDNKLQEQFQARWTRTPSSKLNESLKTNIRKYKDIIINAENADGIVKEKFGVHKDKIALLCLPEHDLLSQIPKGTPMGTSSATDQLKTLMEQVKELLVERNSFKDDLEGPTADMKVKFLSALSTEGSVNEQAFSVEMLGEIFGPVQRRIRENLERQDRIVEQIQNVNNEFCKEKDNNQSAAARETVLSELAAAHDVYMELSSNIKEGTKFYNDFTQVLVAFQSKINDFCFARKTEKDELCKELQKSIVSQATSQPSPAAPAHHTQNPRPARPPPPATTTAPSTAPASWTYPGPAAAGSYGGVNVPPSGMPPYPAYPVFPYPGAQPIQPYPYPYPQPGAPQPSYPQAPGGYQGQPSQQPPPGQMPQQPAPYNYPYGYPQQPYPYPQQQWHQ